jgi:hypothetical protein
MNTEASDLASTNLKEVMYVANQLYQAQGACFSSYILVEEADAIGLRRINKSNRLVEVDNLREGAVQECILHIELVNRPGRARCGPWSA